MLQDFAPGHFENAFEYRVSQVGDTLLVFREDKALLQVEDGILTFPKLGDLPGVAAEDCRSLFSLDGEHFSMPRAYEQEPTEGYCYYPVSAYRGFRPIQRLFPCAVAGSLHRWYRDNRFCGRCGKELEDSKTERALVCPDCGKIVYPKICPAVIVGVRDRERILLTKYAGRAFTNYALIAGFCEIGESAEETVHREVLEEVGVRVKNLQFYKSQPWVFTDTMLMGFFCDLDGTDSITLQESELAVGQWVRREDVPEDTGHLSLTAEMMEQFRLGNA